MSLLYFLCPRYLKVQYWTWLKWVFSFGLSLTLLSHSLPIYGLFSIIFYANLSDIVGFMSGSVWCISGGVNVNRLIWPELIDVYGQISLPVHVTDAAKMLMQCCCWCNVAADALLLLMHCCCWCNVAADALLLLMQCCCWCTVAADAMLLLM